jgi:pyruvate formate lyase activating enzyme
MTGPADTDAATLLRAAEIGRSSGLYFVYAGNLPGHVGEFENTRCPSCTELLIERRGYRILQNRMHDGCCPRCGVAVPGVWG